MRHKRSPLEFTLITWASLAFSTNQCVEPLFGLASCGIIHAGRGFVYLVQSGTNATHYLRLYIELIKVGVIYYSVCMIMYWQ